MGDGNVTGDYAEEVKPVILGEDGEFYNPLVDLHTRANTNIDYNHHEIHEGDHFYISEVITLGNAAVADFVLEVGEKDVHFVFAVWSDIAGFTVQTYEDVTADENGTLYSLLNNNRHLMETKISTAVLRLNPTNVVTAGKVMLRNTRIGAGGTPSSRTGGSLQRSDEVVLDRNIKYLLRITNLSADNNYINVGMSHYEKNIVDEVA